MYLWIYGILLFPVLTFLSIEGYRIVTRLRGEKQLPLPVRLSLELSLGGAQQERTWRSHTQLGVSLWLCMVVLAILTLIVVAFGYGVALVAVPVACVALLLFVSRTPRVLRFLWFMLAQGGRGADEHRL